MDPVAIYFTGTAGAGKTNLTRAFRLWMDSAGYNAVTVNLDPGMEAPAYDPDVDIRDWVKLKDVMEEHELGPNGAQVAASDLIALKVYEVREVLEKLSADYILVDTPGQVELFAFRESSKAIVEALTGERSLIAFLFDPALAKHPGGFVSLLMLASTVQFRFALPTIHLLAKSDLLSKEQLEQVVSWSEEPYTLYDAVTGGTMTPDATLSGELFRALEAMGPVGSILPTSAEKGTGLEDVYASAQRVFAGGEDLERSGGPGSDE